MDYRSLILDFKIIQLHGKSKLRLYVEKALQCNSEKDLEHCLGLFYIYYISYTYKSIPTYEKLLYDELFAVILDSSIPSQWLSPKQLCDEYGYGLSWQAKRRMKNDTMKLPFYKTGGYIKYKRSEIEQWIEEHKIR